MKALIFGADGFEDIELIYPYHRLKEEGNNHTYSFDEYRAYNRTAWI